MNPRYNKAGRSLFTAGGLRAFPVHAHGGSTCTLPPANKNKLYVGFSKRIEPPLGSYLWIDDEVPKIKNARMFDPTKHCFDPLQGMDYRKAVGFVSALQNLFPGGDNTHTKENAQYHLLEALLSEPKSLEKLIPESKDGGKEHARRMIGRLLFSPILKQVLCGTGKEFSFKATWRSIILARINRAELGKFDALALGLLLMNHYKGQIVVPDLGFYGRDIDSNLIREKRTHCGCELPRRAARQVAADLPPHRRQRGPAMHL